MGYWLNYEQDSTLEDFVKFEKESICFNNGKDGITDEEVWEIARESEDIPSINNIYYDLLLYRAIDKYIETYPFLKEDNFQIYINGLDTHFDYIDHHRNIEFNIRNDFEEFEEALYNSKQIFEEIENYKESNDIYDLTELKYLIEYDFIHENNIPTEENFDEISDKLIDFLSEKLPFIDIPMDISKECLNYYIDYEFDLTAVNIKDKVVMFFDTKLMEESVYLDKTGQTINFNGKEYELFNGRTDEDIQKMKEIIVSNNYQEHKLSDLLEQNTKTNKSKEHTL